MGRGAARNLAMEKVKALGALGGTSAAAAAIGISAAAVSKWPTVLPRRITDRVVAALVRMGRPVPPDALYGTPVISTKKEPSDAAP